VISRIQKIATKQGHPTPRSLGYAKGPFPPELYTSPPVVEDYEPETGNGGPEIPDGGTAQNNFRELLWYKCRSCEEIVSERELESHIC
jgi:hypothetical protein